MRGMLLVALLATGCKGMSPAAAEALGHLAALATVATAAGIAAAVAQDAKNGGGDNPSVNSDVRYRRRCTGGRSYKLRCPPETTCFWEDNEGRDYPCGENGCTVVPEQLLRWCGDL
jgi:hypothetical protein